MAYVVPNTTIYLLSDVPLSSDQRDTFYFDSAAQQQTYFRSKVAYTFPAQSYQRVNVGKLRVQLAPAQNVYQCNYLMFTNTSHWNGKWFYAFIDRIDYINENCAEVTYTLDDIQTWFFDYTEEECLVVRQSPYHDTIGYNLQDEGFACGEYICNLVETPALAQGDSDMIGVLYLDNQQNNDAVLVDRAVSAATPYLFHPNPTGVSALNSFIDGHIKKTEDGVTSYYPDNIIGIYMIPHEALNPAHTYNDGDKLSGSTGYREIYNVTGITSVTKIDGYTPKYKKLLTSPYNFLVVDMGNGQSQNYKYEYFDNDIGLLKFVAKGNALPPCNVTYYPMNYKRSRSGFSVDKEYEAEQISSNSYPICSWSTDAWAAWLGQTSSFPLTETTPGWASTLMNIGASLPSINIQHPIKSITGLAGWTIGALNGIRNQSREASIPRTTHTVGQNQIGDPAPSNKLSLNDILNGIASMNPAYRASDIVKGTVYNGNNWYGDTDRCYTMFRRMSITREYAEKIDKYFDAFGYALNEVTTPMRRARSKYTYVQTLGCSVKGRISNDVRERIAECYDNGIRFWNYSSTGDNIGTYDLANNNSLG